MPASASQHARRRRWPRRLGIAVLVLLGALFWLWNGPGDVEAAGLAPFDRTRQPDGSWPPLPDGSPEPAFSVAATSSASRTNHTASLARSSSEGARLASRSFLVRAPSDDALTDAITRRVVAALEQDSDAQRLVYVPDGTEPAPGSLAPDVVIRVGRAELEQDTFLGTGSTRASVRVTAGTDLAVSRHRYHTGGATQRTVEFDLEIDVDTGIDTKGIATPNAQLAAVADELAKPVVTSLREHLADLRAEHGELPELPGAFWPAFRPVEVDELPLGQIEELERLATWRRVLRSNETWWHGLVPRSADEALAWLAQQAVTAGFTRHDRGTSGLRFERGRQELVVFFDQPPRSRGARIEVFEPAAPTAAARTPIYLRFREQLTDEEVARAVDTTLTEDAPAELLTLFAPAWTPAQRQRGRALLEAHERLELDGLLLRARLRAKGGDAPGAAADLQAAALVARTTFGDADPEERVEKAAEQLELELAPDAPTAERLLAAGYVELAADAEPLEGEVRPDRPLRWFVREADRTILFGLGLVRDEQGRWRGACRMVDGGMRSEIGAMDQGTSNHVLPGGRSVRLELLDPPDDGAARARVGREG